MNKYRIAFFGTPEIAKGVLETLTKMEEVEVVVVISQPDRSIGRKQEVIYSPVKQFCLDQNLTCLQPEKVSTIYEQLEQANLDFIITCAYGQFVPSKILAIPKIDALNLHGSLLPKYRGGAPIQYAILNGDETTGVSLMRMVKAMDAGPVFSTREIKLDPRETTGSLFIKMEQLSQQLIREDLIKVAQKKLTPVEQDESKATFAYNITSEQELIDWRKTNFQIDCLVRALTPRPVSHTFFGTERYKIGTVKPISDLPKQTFLPGTIIEFDAEGIVVQTGDGLIKILEIQRPGKKMQPAKVYFENQNLHDLVVGQKFG